MSLDIDTETIDTHAGLEVSRSYLVKDHKVFPMVGRTNFVLLCLLSLCGISVL